MKLLQRTQSICPVCRIPLAAAYESDGGKVFLRKTCKEHGVFESCISESEEDFLGWIGNPVINVPPKKALTSGTKGNLEPNLTESQCPLHCGTCENHLQTACCVLIDITDRCNQHCPYCFAAAEKEGHEGTELEPDLSEMERKFDLLMELGEERPFNIQLSGGEPTIREDLPDIIRMARKKGFVYIQINTNGKRLASELGYAKILRDAGASAVFLQFDGTEDSIYEVLRGEALFEIKKKAIDHCRRAGLPVTIVPTVVKHVNVDNIGAMIEFLLQNVDVIKGIHFQPVSFFGRHPDTLPFDGEKHRDFENRVTMFDIMHELERQTDGKCKYDDFYPITSGHTLCCFSSTYQKQRDGKVKSLISYKTKLSGIGCCDRTNPLDIIKKDRNFVLNKWNLPDSDGSCCCTGIGDAGTESGNMVAGSGNKDKTGGCKDSGFVSESSVMDFDQFLRELKGSMFSVSSMAFQDISNLDAERLKRCRVQVLSPDDRLIPFCAYNSIYRGV